MIAPYLKLPNVEFTINNTDTIQENISITFVDYGFMITLMWDRAFIVVEGNYTAGTRYDYMGHDPTLEALGPSDLHHEEEEH